MNNHIINPSVHRKVSAEKKNKNNYFSFQIVNESKKTIWMNQKIISEECQRKN